MTTPTPLARSIRLRVLAVGVVLSLLVAVAAALIYGHNHGWMYDAKVYRTGAAMALHGRNIYATSIWPPFTYTPFAALLFIPLFLLLPLGAVGVLWTAVSIFALAASVWLSLGMLGVRSYGLRLVSTATACALALWLDPISATLLAGQVNLVLMVAVLFDYSLPDASRWKGGAIGVAAGIKLLPAFFIVHLLLTRRLRAAAVAVAAFAATVAVGFAGAAAGSARYWGGLFLDSSRVGAPQNVRSQSLRSVLVRWAHTSQGIEPAWIVLCALVVVVALGLAVWAHRRGDELLAVCLCATATLLISPITWQHHWVWVVPGLLWLAGRAWRARSPLLWVALGAVALEFFARPYQWIPVDSAANLRLDLGQLLLSSTYAATAVVFLATAGIGLRRRRREALHRGRMELPGAHSAGAERVAAKTRRRIP